MNATAQHPVKLNVARGVCSTWRATQSGWLAACAGSVWITVEGDLADYWLAPGEAVPLAAGECARIGGWNEAVVCEWWVFETAGVRLPRAQVAWCAQRVLRAARWSGRRVGAGGRGSGFCADEVGKGDWGGLVGIVGEVSAAALRRFQRRIAGVQVADASAACQRASCLPPRATRYHGTTRAP